MKHLVDETSQKSAVEPLHRYMLHGEIRCQLYSYFTLVKAHLMKNLLDETSQNSAVQSFYMYMLHCEIRCQFYSYSPLHLECHLLSISNLNLRGLFSTERG